MPDTGHCSSAATSASCASSSARPTSRTIRARPAISRADSILQTASIVRCISEAVTVLDHNIFDRSVQGWSRQQRVKPGKASPRRNEETEIMAADLAVPTLGLPRAEKITNEAAASPFRRRALCAGWRSWQ
jgi:hypothetical protein